jgi:hypothetical protein
VIKTNYEGGLDSGLWAGNIFKYGRKFWDLLWRSEKVKNFFHLWWKPTSYRILLMHFYFFYLVYKAFLENDPFFKLHIFCSSILTPRQYFIHFAIFWGSLLLFEYKNFSGKFCGAEMLIVVARDSNKSIYF